MTKDWDDVLYKLLDYQKKLIADKEYAIVDKRRTAYYPQSTMGMMLSAMFKSETIDQGDGTYMHIWHHTEFPDAHEDKINFFNKPLPMEWPVYMSRMERTISVDTGAVEWKPVWYESPRVQARIGRRDDLWTKPKGPETLFESMQRLEKKYGGKNCEATLRMRKTGSSESP